MAQTMTNVKALSAAIETLMATEGFSADAIQKLENIKASYERKSSGSKKPTATQVANEGVKADLLAAMDPDQRYTVTEITKLVDYEISTQKVSALLRQMIAAGQVDKVTEKQKSLYFVV